jgi:poly(3-hydroxyalkanoate) synthetase
VVKDSLLHGVQLRYYPSQQKSADKNPIIYLSSPLINRAEFFDLTPGKSVIEGLLSNGHHVYLVDYSQAGEQDTGQGGTDGNASIV